MTTASPTPEESADLDALFTLALREHQAGRLLEADAAYRRILALRPDVAQVHNNLGILLWQREKFDEAVQHFEQAIAAQPDFADAHNNLGNAFRGQGRIEQAIHQYRQVVTLLPEHPEARNNLGSILLEQGKTDEAQAQFAQAIALRPDYAEAHCNFATVLREQGHAAQALAHYDQALALRPDFAEAHYHLGVYYWQQDELDRAVTCFQQALTLKPNYPEALNNLGITLREQLKLSEAQQTFERLQTLAPDSPYAQLGLALCWLVAGDYRQGWPALEARLRLLELPRLDMPRWTGQPLEGRSILLLAEQGFGDTFHFLRYARLLKERGARVVLAVPEALGPLLAKHPYVDELFVLGSAERLPDCDCYLPMLSAPGAFRTAAASIPARIPYLWPDPELQSKWEQELGQIEGFKIGIVWQGSRDFASDRRRSIPLADFAPLAAVPGVRLISLQKGFGSEQLATVDFPVLDPSGRMDETTGPFLDTAAVIAGLDLVVTPDTAIAHLAGALGARVFLALQLSPNWRWLLDRDDSPWYPQMRLFRQPVAGDWPDVMRQIAAAVATLSGKSA